MATKEDKKEQDNLAIYEQARSVPKTALKQIYGGRLKGMSDINPMFRIKRITEIFGPCGFGWKYEIVEKRFETQGQEVKCFIQINLYVKWQGEWSEPIPGVGGAGFVDREKNGLFVNDEAEKMAMTDALGVAMKALGVAADVYWDKDGKAVNTDSKYAYDTIQQPQQQQAKPTQTSQPQQQKIQFQEFNPDTELVAEQEMLKCNSYQELMAVWNKYNKINPQYCRKDGVLARAFVQRNNELNPKK